MKHDNPSELASELSRNLSVARVRNNSIFLTTAVSYPNGVGVAVKIDRGRDGYVVSDDGYASQIAEGMQALGALARIAPAVAEQSGICYERGAFAISTVARENLTTSVVVIANASATAMVRLVASLEKVRIKRSRKVFDERLQAAFGRRVAFDIQFEGATNRAWDFSAGVSSDGIFVRLFELVSPTTQSVAMANMKFGDIRALMDPPAITAALVDYEKTEPSLRSILSATGSTVISANDDVSKYQLDAA